MPTSTPAGRDARPTFDSTEAAPGRPPTVATGGCRACPISRYCALNEPASLVVPLNCPFGPGASRDTPAPSHRQHQPSAAVG